MRIGIDISQAPYGTGVSHYTKELVRSILEIDKEYDRCFSKKRLASVTFLTFLQNLHDNLGLVLKKDLNLTPRNDGPKPSRLVNYVLCLLVRHLARTGQHEFILQRGDEIYGRDWQLREDIARVLRSPRSGIRSEVAKRFMYLESSKAAELKAAFDQVQRTLRLREDIDPFDIFSRLDERLAEVE